MKHFLSLIIVLFTLPIFGQNKLDFSTTDHNFGEINEKDGFAEFTFDFVNTGDEPIKILNVRASCGCTTPGWTREQVMPGDSGFVKARYNPRNRPGKFRKSLRISTQGGVADQTLYISGFVKPKPKTLEQEYAFPVGNLRLKNSRLNFGKITTEKPVEKIFDVYNYSDTVSILDKDKMKIPAHIDMALVQDSLQPRKIGQIKLTYDPKKKNDYGYVSDNIQFDDNSAHSMSVIAVIEEYFPVMTADELDSAPKLAIPNRSHDFGKVAAGTLVEMNFELTNEGKEKLYFRSVKSNCGCVTYELNNKGIKKGKSQTLKVFFDTVDMRGNQYKSITIYSNDPVAPTQIITLKGKVEQ